MNFSNRVFITGLGAVSPYGSGANQLWQATLQARALYKKIPKSWLDITSYSSDIYLPLPTFDYSEFELSKIEQLLYDPAVLNLFIAITESTKDAGIEVDFAEKKSNKLRLVGFDPYKLGAFIGSGNGGIKSLLDNYRHFILSKFLSTNPNDTLRSLVKVPSIANKFVTARQMPNAVADSVGIKYSIKGKVSPAYYACASSTIALGNAYRSIKDGTLDCAIAGGTEYATDHLGSTFKSFDMTGTLTKEINGTYYGPFDKNSNGFLFSEGGAGALILESEKSVDRRGAEPIAEITAFVETFDSHNIMAPEENGKELERLYISLLDQAGLDPIDVQYINAHGTGTKNDVIEADVLNRAFPNKPAVSSSKGVIGHTLGASGSLETIITALFIKNGIIAPSGSLVEPITSINLPTAQIELKIQNAAVTSSSFGGHNAALMLTRI